MTINSVPERSNALDDADKLGNEHFSAAWLEFFRSVFYALFGWKRSFTASGNIDFGLIGAGAELTSDVAVVGARAGDAVLVTPKAHVAGLGCSGFVSANDVVTVVRSNFSAAGINPAADDFRILVWQQ